MRTDTTSVASLIFAANRAQGAVTFDVRLVEGLTRRHHLHESGSLRVRFPSPEADGLSAVFVNTAGGVAGGDRFDIDIAAGEGSRLTLTTAAAEKIYRAESIPAQLNISLKAKAGAHLRWLIRRGGRLVFAETVRLDGDIGAKLASHAIAKGGVAIGTALIMPGDEALVERVGTLS